MSVQEDDWIDLLGLEDTEGGDLLDLLEGEGDFEDLLDGSKTELNSGYNSGATRSPKARDDSVWNRVDCRGSGSVDVSDSEPTPSKTRTDSWPEAREGSVASEHHSCEAAATSASLEGDLRSGVSKHAATRTASRVTGGTPKARAAHPQDSLGDAARKERARQTTRRLRAGQQEIIKELRDTNDALVVRNRHLEAQIVALAAENAQLRAMVGLRPGWSFLPARAPGSAQSLSQSQAQAYTQVQPGREPAAPAGAVHLVGGQPIPPRSHALASARCAAPGTRPAAPVPPPQAASVDLRQSPGASHSSAAAGIPPQPTPGLAATALPPAAPGAARPAGGVLGKRALFSPGPLGQHIGAGKRMRQVASVLAAGLALVGLASVYPTGGPLGPPGARRTLQAGPSAPAAESKALVPFGWLDRHPGREGQSRGLQADDAGVCGWGGCVEGDEAVWMLDHDWEAADQMSRGGRGALTLARCAAPHLLSGRAVDLHALVEGRSSLPRFEHQPGEADPSRALVPLSWGESDLVDISELPCLRDCVAVTGQPSPSSLDSIQSRDGLAAVMEDVLGGARGVGMATCRHVLEFQAAVAGRAPRGSKAQREADEEVARLVRVHVEERGRDRGGESVGERGGGRAVVGGGGLVQVGDRGGEREGTGREVTELVPEVIWGGASVGSGYGERFRGGGGEDGQRGSGGGLLEASRVVSVLVPDDGGEVVVVIADPGLHYSAYACDTRQRV